MMFRLDVPTERGSVLNGVLFRKSKNKTADTVMIAITGIHGNFYSNPFYYNIGDTLNADGIDFIYAQTNDAFGEIRTVNVRTGNEELIGSFNERFSYTDEDIDAYLTFAEKEGYQHIILAGHSLGANKVICYLSRLKIRYVMSLLVRDVSDFMLPEKRALDPEEGIRRYCSRLAGIYKNEETIGGLPINMDGFCLFDPEHRTSKPLNLAYKAAQLSDPDKADAFLTELRHSIVVDCLPATHFDVILKIVRQVGIDEAAFTRHYRDGSAEAALDRDLQLTRRLGIHSLPSYRIQYGGRSVVLQSFYVKDFVGAISGLTG